MGVRRLTYETEAAAGPIVVELAPSSGVTGEWTIDEEGRHGLRAFTEEALVIERVRAPFPHGTVELEGTVRGDDVDVDLTSLPIDAAIAIGRLSGDATVTMGPDGPPARLERGLAEGVSITLGSVHRVDLDRLQLGRLELVVGEASVRFDHATAHVVAYRAAPAGRWRLRIGRLLAQRVTIGHGADRLRLDDVQLTHLVLDSQGGVQLSDARARRARWRRSAWPDRPANEQAAGPSVPWRALLSRLDGRVAADVHTEVKVAMLPSWSVLHPLGIELERGRVRYEDLEGSMHRIPDAILDFELAERRLELVKDIPLVPFDRRVLLSWPLATDEQADAAEGWIGLERLLSPTVHVRSRPRGRDEGSQRLEAVRVEALSVEVGARGGGTIDLGPLGTIDLREEGAGVQRFAVDGRLVYRPDARSEPGHVELGGDGIRFAAAPLRVAGRGLRFGVAVDRIRWRVELDGTGPSSGVADILGLAVDDLAVAPSSRAVDEEAA